MPLLANFFYAGTHMGHMPLDDDVSFLAGAGLGRALSRTGATPAGHLRQGDGNGGRGVVRAEHAGVTFGEDGGSCSALVFSDMS